jgi:hypothetical protein
MANNCRPSDHAPASDKALNDRLQTSRICPEARSPEALRRLLRIDMEHGTEV